MRLPLFNGLPRFLLSVDGEITVLDTSDLDPKTTYAVTLFVWIFQNGPGVFTAPNLQAKVSTEGGAGEFIALTAAGSFLTSFQAAVLAGTQLPAPVAVLQDYMVRGEQEVTIANLAAAGPCVIWGYYEAVGRASVGVPYRGLQPAKPKTPFTYPPAYIENLGPDDNAQEEVHQLDPNYIDLVTIDVAGSQGEDGAEVASALAFPGAVLVALPFMPSANGLRYRIFDGIPMRALGSATADSMIYLVSDVNTSVVTFLAAYGSFLRV